MCDNTYCFSYYNSNPKVPYYLDNDQNLKNCHLNAGGSRLIGIQYLKKHKNPFKK
jgi:hypothetical protein